MNYFSLTPLPIFSRILSFTHTEDEFCAQYPGALALVVAVPLDEEYAAFNFNGQRIEIEVRKTCRIEMRKVIR